MKDIPLTKAMIAWNPLWMEAGGAKRRIGVCRHPDNGQLSDLRLWVYPEQRAHPSPYTKDELETRLILMIEAWQIACRDAVPLADIHTALSAIPEYREMLAEDFAVNVPEP